MDLEDLTDMELDELQQEFGHLAREKLAARRDSRPPGSRKADAAERAKQKALAPKSSRSESSPGGS